MDDTEENREQIGDPFLSFPEEIWEPILDLSENTDDIQSAFTVFPQLTTLAHGKQFSWLFADLIPLLFPKLLNFTEIKKCRLVSKRWKHAIDKCLETHMDRLPYNSCKPSNIPENHFNYHQLSISTNIMKFLWTDWSPYSNGTDVDNPFPGRSVRIIMDYLYDSRNDHLYSPSSIMKMKEGQGQMLSLLKRFGHHIWFLTIELPNLQINADISRMSELLGSEVIYCLFRLPNLKSLQLKMYSKFVVREDSTRNIMDSMDSSLIPAKLECLDLLFYGGSSVPTTALVAFLKLFAHHEQIKKLTIYVGQWREEIKGVLPSLTELSIIQGCGSPDVPRVPYEPVLDALSFTYLKKLRLMAEQVKINVILEYLSKQNLESLELRGQYFIDDKAKDIKYGLVRDGFVKSIQHLTMSTMYNLNFRFLRKLPSLKILTLHVGSVTARSDMFLTDSADPVSVCVNYMCGKALDGKGVSQNFKSMWDKYPNLMVVRVENYYDKCTCQCARECGTRVFRSFYRV